MRRDLLMTLAVLSGFVISDTAMAGEGPPAAERAVKAFIEAVASADGQAIAAILAPEYQIMRADGVGYDREGYLAGGLPKIDNNSLEWRFENLVATASDDLMVVRYHLVIDETIDHRPVTRRAPRLTVFRRDGEDWRVVAHANFARFE